MDGQITFFKDVFFCNTINKVVTLSGVKHSLFCYGKLTRSTILDAKCNGDDDCLFDIISQSCPKKF